MSIQQRSKSAPQLVVAFRDVGDSTIPSHLQRRQQSFIHSQRPRDEPFALSGFFPSYVSSLKESDGDEGWNWLREDEGEDIESVYTASEEDPTAPATPVEYDGSENPDRVIQREDKLGILRLREYLTRPLIPYHRGSREL